MKRFILIALSAAAVISLVMLAPELFAGGKKSDSVVTIKAKVDKAGDGKSVVVFSLDIKSGWHLYANPVGHEDLESGKVVVKSVAGNADITYPPGKTIDDKILGKYSVYKDKVEIRAAVDRVIDAANPAEFTIRLQSCDEKNCLQPSTVKVTVP